MLVGEIREITRITDTEQKVVVGGFFCFFLAKQT